MTKYFLAMLKNEDGATLVEYALIVSLIAVAAIAALQNLSGHVGSTLSNAAGKMS
jgi:pilus assembly protein Flp/PilA